MTFLSAWACFELLIALLRRSGRAKSLSLLSEAWGGRTFWCESFRRNANKTSKGKKPVLWWWGMLTARAASRTLVTHGVWSPLQIFLSTFTSLPLARSISSLLAAQLATGKSRLIPCVWHNVIELIGFKWFGMITQSCGAPNLKRTECKYCDTSFVDVGTAVRTIYLVVKSISVRNVLLFLNWCHCDVIKCYGAELDFWLTDFAVGRLCVSHTWQGRTYSSGVAAILCHK